MIISEVLVVCVYLLNEEMARQTPERCDIIERREKKRKERGRWKSKLAD
jgi:hypothetical protein